VRPASEPKEVERPQEQPRPRAAPIKKSVILTPTINDTRIDVSDELGALILDAACTFENSSSWDAFVTSSRHDSDMHAEVAKLPHPASHILQQYRKRGLPVTMRTTPWSQKRKDAAISRGAHLSARQHVAFLRTEFASMIKKGQWAVLPARLVRRMRKLGISPIGVVPQRDRRPRTIVEYSFFDVNE
jgi:hypothetical protein